MAATVCVLGPTAQDLMVEASEVVEMVDDYIGRSAHRAVCYCWLNGTADQTYSCERFALDRNPRDLAYRRADSRANRSADGRADRSANGRADCCSYCSSDRPPDSTSNATPDSTTRQPVRCATQSVELQLLRWARYLRGAVQLLRLLQLHPVVLAVDQRLRRTVRRRHLLAFGRAQRSLFIPRRGTAPAVRLMGFMRWAWKHSATRQMLKPAPKPKRAMATVGGTTHRLVWSDRNAGWRFRCTCGWIDPKVRWTERNAINAGNGHIRSVRWRGR